MQQLLSLTAYNALPLNEKIEYEETVVQPLYDNLYSTIKCGESTHKDRCVFLDVADQYVLTWTAAEEHFFHRRLQQLHELYPELRDRIEAYYYTNNIRAANTIQQWWCRIRSQLVVCYRCHTLGTPICERSRKCGRCYEEQYHPDYGWDTADYPSKQ